MLLTQEGSCAVKISQPKQWEKDREMSMDYQPELKLSTRTEQLASSRDAAMQNFANQIPAKG